MIQVGVLRAEIVTLTHAVKTMEQTILTQQSVIQKLSEENDKRIHETDKSTDSKLSSLEKRLIDMWDLREKTYATKDDIASIDKKVEKMSSQANTATQLARNCEKKFADTPSFQPLEENVKELRGDVNTMRNEVLSIKQTLHSLEDPTSFVCMKNQQSSNDTSALVKDTTHDDTVVERTNNTPATPVSIKPPEKIDTSSGSLPAPSKNGDHKKMQQPQTQKWGDSVYQPKEATQKMKAETAELGNTAEANNNENRSTDDMRSGELSENPQMNRGIRQPLKKTFLFMDSNRAHINPTDLWKNLSIIPCQNLDSLRCQLSNTRLDDVGIVFIHTGVNDIDTVDGVEVGKDIVSIVQKLRHAYPHLKIVISEITPRKFHKDDEVQLCNNHLHTHLRNLESVTIARHSNLRNEKWTFHRDDKHFTAISISLFAANIKNALRKCLGIPSKKTGKDERGVQRKRHHSDSRNKNSDNDNKKNLNKNKNITGSNRKIDSFRNDLIKFLTNYKV